MSLLGNIAAALSAGVGEGMVGAGKWGIEEEAQRKKDEQENARNQKLMERYDADRESREGIFAGQLEEMKNERLSRAEQAAADRENAWRIANIRASSSGGGGESSSLRELKFIDSQITSFDNTIEDLNKAYAAEVDPEKQKAIAGQIDNWRSKRQAFVTSDVVQKTIASNGKLGELYSAALYGGATAAKPEQAQDGNIPASLVAPPPRAVVKPDDSLTSKGLLNGMRNEMRTPSPQAATGQPQSGDPILGRVSRDLGSVADGAAGVYNWLDNKFNPAREGRYIGGN